MEDTTKKDREQENALIERCYLKDTYPDSDYDPEQLKRGIKVEHEHTFNPLVSKIIAKHHIREFSNYYDGLDFAEEVMKGTLDVGIYDAKTDATIILEGKGCSFQDEKNIVCEEIKKTEE